MKKLREKYPNAVQAFLSRNEDRFIPGPQSNKKVDNVVRAGIFKRNYDM